MRDGGDRQRAHPRRHCNRGRLARACRCPQRQQAHPAQGWTDFIERFLQYVLPCGFKRIRHYGLLAAARKQISLAAARTALDAPVTAPRAHRVGGGVPASRLTHRDRAVPALRQRSVSCRRGNPTQSSPAPSAGTAVTIDVGHSVARRSDGAAVRGLAPSGRRQRCLRIRCSPCRRRPNGATLPSQRVGERRCLPPLHAIRLTSGSATLQSP